MKILQNSDAQKPLSYLPSVNLVDRFLRFLFGDDIFISYSHRDAINYAPALATALSDKRIVSYLDQYGGEVENELPARVIRHLRRSTAFVLIGTPASVQSNAVKKEVEIFKTTGRPIIPIDIGNALTRAEWIEIVKGIPVSHQSRSSIVPAATPSNGEVALALDSSKIIEEQISLDLENLEAPSPLVVSRVVSSFTYTKRNQRQQRMFLAAFILLVASLAGAAISFYQLWDARIEAVIAIDDRRKAQEQEKQANDNAKSAELQKERAEVARGLALKQKADADEAATAAVAREQIALNNEARASANAHRQQTRASSLEKVATSSRLIGAELGTAMNAGVSAYKQYPTREAQGRLLDNLQRYPGLEKIRRNHITDVYSIESPLQGVIVSVARGEHLPWATGITPKRNNLIFWDAHTLKAIAVHYTAADFNRSKISCIPGGNLCASNDEDGTIVLWIVDTTNKQVRRHKTNIRASYSSSGFELISEKLLAVAHRDGQIDLVDLNKPDGAATPVPTGFGLPPNQIAVNAKKDLLAVAFGEGIALINLSQPGAPKCLRYSQEQIGRFGNANSLSFSADEELLAIGTHRRASLIVRVSDLRLVGEPIEDGGGLVAFPRDKSSDKLVTANTNGLSIWELSNFGAYRYRRLQIEVNGVRSIRFLHESSEKLVTGMADGTIAVWDLSRGNKLSRSFTDVEDPSNVHSFEFDQSGKYMVGYKHVDVAGPAKRIWRVADNAYTLDSAGGPDVRFPRRLTRVTDKAVWFENRRDVSKTDMFVLTPGGKDILRLHAVLTSDDRTMVTIDGNEVVVWDVSNREKAKVKGRLSRGSTPTSVAISHNDKILAVGYKGGEIALFDLRSRRRIGSLSSPLVTKNVDSHVSAIAFSFHDNMIASSSSSRSIELWDSSSLSLIGSLDSRNTDNTDRLVFTPSGDRLLSYGFRGWHIWDISPASWINRTVNIIGLKN